MNIEVQQKHIDTGGKQCGNCPVALAINRKLDQYYASVGLTTIYILNKDNLIQLELALPTPTNVIKFIIRFDNDHPVEPFSFDLDIPQEYLGV